MRRSLALLAATTLLVAMSAPAALAAPARGQAPGANAAVIAHWTPARMAQAQWRDRSLPIPNAKPGGGGTSGAVTGASWTKGGAVVKGTGKVYFEMGGGAWICSGTVITDSRATYSVVLTAGHCTVDETTGAFATNWMFIPSFDTAPTYTCASTTYGCWTALSLVTPTKFATAGGFTTTATLNDWGFAVVGAGDRGTQLDATVGSFTLTAGSASKGATAYAFGYPAGGKYHGSDLTYCSGAIVEDANAGNQTWGLGCDMTGGSSGGPWFTSFNTATGSGVVSSLNSYGYSGSKFMYGPKFNSDTSATFAAANAATGGNQLVP